MSEEEFDKFRETLMQKLPVVFRVNPGLLNYQSLVDMFKDEQFIAKYSDFENLEKIV
jgi:hypothetical protein